MTAAQDKAAASKGGNVEEQTQAQHESRVTLGDTEGLAKDVAVDARLDNRTGDARPRRVDFPAAPQQVDGPDLPHQNEYTRRYLDGLEKSKTKAGDLLGAHSAGPHSLSKDEERKGHDRADESGGKAAPDGEQGSPDVGKVTPAQQA
jgi:hypothetical protein